MAEELDVSRQSLRAEGAKTMATFIKNNGALVCEDGDLYEDTYQALDQPEEYLQLAQKVMAGNGTDEDNERLEQMADQVLPVSTLSPNNTYQIYVIH